MDFISNKAMEDRPLVFSDDEEEKKMTDELDNFLDNGSQPEEDVNFYRQLDPANIDDYSKFNGQTCNPIEAIYEDDTPFYGHEDQQPELYSPEDRESVSVDKFEGSEKSIEKFKKTLKISRVVKISFLMLSFMVSCTIDVLVNQQLGKK